MKTTVLLALSIVGVLAIAPAYAAFAQAGSSGEANFVNILNHIYGPGFGGTAFAGMSYTNGTYTLTRVDDTGVGSPMYLSTGHAGTANDQVWRDGTVSASAEARFASSPQRFGYDPGADGGYVNLFDVSGQGFNATGGINQFTFGSLFAFARAGGDYGPYYSLNSLNHDGFDHMLTYEVAGLGSKAWLLFWEDTDFAQFPQRCADGDYNDLVVEIRVTPAVPAPTASVLGAVGLCTVVGLRRRLPGAL